jgi:hypothetical protein
MEKSPNCRLAVNIVGFLVTGLLLGANAQSADILDSYNVVWDSQSSNPSESMPVGGGDIGLNVWVENNELLFYIGRSGTFDENNHMLFQQRRHIPAGAEVATGLYRNHRQNCANRHDY